MRRTVWLSVSAMYTCPDRSEIPFGPDSFEAHLRAARDRDAEARVCENGHLSFDLDTAGDLAKYREGEAGGA